MHSKADPEEMSYEPSRNECENLMEDPREMRDVILCSWREIR